MKARPKAKTKPKAKASQLIVVDANILRGASSSDRGPPPGVDCRRALQAILAICHRAVVSPALAEEYEHHASGFGQRWLTWMARRSKIVQTPAKETGRARGWKQDPSFEAHERRAVEKDLHLVLAAWEADAVILSGDDAARALFARLTDLKYLGWARMTHNDVDGWLDDGAPAHAVWLGS